MAFGQESPRGTALFPPGRPLPSPFQSFTSSAPSTPPLNVSRSFSTPPLGRSTHAERAQAARRDEEQAEEDADMLPASPSPMKPHHNPAAIGDGVLIPKFELTHTAAISTGTV
jgi:hypothetical protein